MLDVTACWTPLSVANQATATLAPLTPMSGSPRTLRRSPNREVVDADRRSSTSVTAVVARRQTDGARVGLGPDGEQPTAADRDPRVVDPCPSRGDSGPARARSEPLIEAHPHPEDARRAGPVVEVAALGDLARDHGAAMCRDRRPLGLDARRADAASACPIGRPATAPGNAGRTRPSCGPLSSAHRPDGGGQSDAKIVSSLLGRRGERLPGVPCVWR